MAPVKDQVMGAAKSKVTAAKVAPPKVPGRHREEGMGAKPAMQSKGAVDKARGASGRCWGAEARAGVTSQRCWTGAQTRVPIPPLVAGVQSPLRAATWVRAELGTSQPGRHLVEDTGCSGAAPQMQLVLLSRAGTHLAVLGQDPGQQLSGEGATAVQGLHRV